jgi:hypothetical protein
MPPASSVDGRSALNFYVAILKSQFDIDLPEAASLWPALCERHETYLRESAARRAAKAEAANQEKH